MGRNAPFRRNLRGKSDALGPLRPARDRRRADREHPHRRQAARRHPGHPARPAASLRKQGLAPAGVRAARGRGRAGGAQGRRPAGHGPLAHSGAGVPEQGLGCDFDRLAHMANHDGLVRRMPGHSPALGHACEQQAAVANVSLSGPKLLSGIGRLVAGSGREAAGKKPGEPLRGRAGSFCVETDAHYPTDADLLRDALRCAVRTAARLADSAGLGGWRQHEHLSRQVKKRFDRVRVSRRSRKHPGRVERHLSLSARLAGRAEATLAQAAELPLAACEHALACELEGYLGHARRQLEQARRRLLGGETIAHGEKAFSIFEPHTRWVAEGKAGVRQELGVPVAVVEDQRRFILHRRIMWQGGDAGHAAALVEGAMERFADLRACSFDRGFHSPANQAELGARLDECALPAKGRPNAEASAREGREWFQAARRQHPAVESAINHLEHCGLGRARAHGERGFERAAALSALAANPERLGRLLRDQERKRLARRARLRAA